MKKELVVLCVLMILILSAYLPSAPVKDSPSPTSTLQPTLTPEQTTTPDAPTLPGAVSEVLSDVKIEAVDTFENLDNWMVWIPGSITVSDGVFKLTGQKDWTSGAQFNQNVIENRGILVKFKVEKNIDYNSDFVLVSGDWQTDSFRQFGIYTGARPKADLYQGKNGLGFVNLNGNLPLRAATWYNLLIAMGRNGEFYALIWNPDKPTQRDIYHEHIGEKWAGLEYNFVVKANIGEIVYIKDLVFLSFSGIK